MDLRGFENYVDEGGGGGVMEVRIDKDLIGEEGSGWNEITDSRKTKRRVRKANSVFDAGCNERGTDRRNASH